MLARFSLFRCRTRRKPQRPPAARPCLERLEDRLTPAFSFGGAFAVGGPASDNAQTVVVDDGGNVYVAGKFGLFGSTVDFDPGPGVFNLTTASPDALYVAK